MLMLWLDVNIVFEGEINLAKMNPFLIISIID